MIQSEAIFTSRYPARELSAGNDGPFRSSQGRGDFTAETEVIEGKYTVELFKQGGEGAGIERVLASNDSPPIALRLYDLQARTPRPWRFSPS